MRDYALIYYPQQLFLRLCTTDVGGDEFSGFQFFAYFQTMHGLPNLMPFSRFGTSLFSGNLATRSNSSATFSPVLADVSM